MLLSAVSVLVVAQSSSEIPEGLMNNPVFLIYIFVGYYIFFLFLKVLKFCELVIVLRGVRILGDPDSPRG